MRIVNAMFSEGKGGIEQAFLDYTDALLRCGHEVRAYTRPNAWVNGELEKRGLTPHLVPHLGAWDWMAVRRLKDALRRDVPDAGIAHGNRASAMLCRAAHKTALPLIGVAHNYTFDAPPRLNAVFAITEDLKEKYLSQGFPGDRVFHIPNMVMLPDELPVPAPWRSPPIIGAMGRFVTKKGFSIFIEALAELQRRGIMFSAVLAGDGGEKGNLQRMAKALGLEASVTFPGWAEDKPAFFRSIDIFCMPSLHEPFGIVLLEAFAACIPAVTTDTEGPNEIVEPDKDARVVPKGNAVALADALISLLHDEAAARAMAANAYAMLQQRFDMPVVSQMLDATLHQVLNISCSP